MQRFLFLLPLPFLYLNYKLNTNTDQVNNRMDKLETRLDELINRIRQMKIHTLEQ